MVRLPDTPGEWEENRHTSGRLFLTNRETSETKWLWQKWEMNGRPFVRNIADPSQHLWVDAMDFHMRIASGMATPEEVEQYKRHGAGPPPPPPPPPPIYPPHLPYPPPPTQNGIPAFRHPNTHNPALHSHPYPPAFQPPPPTRPIAPPAAPFNRHVPPASYADATKGYPPPYQSGPPGPHGQYNGYPPPAEGHPPHHHPPLPPPSVNPQVHSRFRALPAAPHDRYDSAHHFPPHNLPSAPFPLEYNRDATAPPFPTGPQPDPSSQRYDSEHQQPPFHHHDARNHSFAPDFEQTPNQTEKRNRFQEITPNNTGRYWANNQDSNRSKKRLKSDKGANGKQKQGKSRFAALAPVPKPIPQYPPRQPPQPIEHGDMIPATHDANFRPASKYAKSIAKVCLQVADVSKVAILYNRDFKSHTHVNGTSSPQDTNGYGEYAYEAVVGTCEEIEKDFLRLTSAPKPSAVRPPHVLKRAVAHIKTLWGEAERDYDWVCRQLKSVRQDYKVQHVESTEVLEAYETHARIALEKSDLGEFNTCVAQLQELYKKVSRAQHIQDEFSSYRILYNLLVDAREWEQSKILAQFSKAERTRTATRFALSIRQAVLSGNYQSYFKLSTTPPRKTMIHYLLDHFHNRVRWRAISTMISAYGPTKLPITYVHNQLGWADIQDPSEFSGADLAEIIRSKAGESGLLKDFNSLKLEFLPRSTLKAISFLLTIGVVFTFGEKGKPGKDRLLMDCKATKMAGLKKYEASKLITHAGAERS